MTSAISIATSTEIVHPAQRVSYLKSMIQSRSSVQRPSNTEFHQEWEPQSSSINEVIFSEKKCKPKIRSDIYVPRGRDAWTEYMMQVVKSNTCVRYLTDIELKSVVQQARRAYKQQFDAKTDSDLPHCYNWTEEEVADWLSNEGFPEFREMILANRICGRKLISLDATALNKMGVRDLDSIKGVTSKIRELLGIPRPNMMRALARVVPFEMYLRKRMYTGRRVDALTFKEFCRQLGFPYDALLKSGKTGNNSCPVSIEHLEGEESLEDINSLEGAPTGEEENVRNVGVHNQVVQGMIEETLSSVLGEDETCKATSLPKKITVLLDAGYKALDITDECRHSQERLCFASQVANGLVQEMMRCASILLDIEATKAKLECDVTPEELQDMRVAATVFIEQVLPLASLLSAGQFSLESIFRQEPEFNQFVDSICSSALAKVEEDDRKSKMEGLIQALSESKFVKNKVVEIEEEPVDCKRKLTEYGDLPLSCADNLKHGKRFPCPSWPPRDKDPKQPVKSCKKWEDDTFDQNIKKRSVFISSTAYKELSFEDGPNPFSPSADDDSADIKFSPASAPSSSYSSSYGNPVGTATRTPFNSLNDGRQSDEGNIDMLTDYANLHADYYNNHHQLAPQFAGKLIPKSVKLNIN